MKPTYREYSDEALRSFFGGRKAEKPDRPQNVLTPQPVIDAILELWPEGIFLDPCAAPNSLIPARYEIFDGGMAAENLKDGHVRLYLARNMTDEDQRWPAFTYCNPPYRFLKEWIRKARPGAEHLFLVPMRTNRKWFRRWLATASRFNWFDPLPFHGHKQTFPAPITLVYFGTRITDFDRIFRKFGDPGQVILW